MTDNPQETRSTDLNQNILEEVTKISCSRPKQQVFFHWKVSETVDKPQQSSVESASMMAVQLENVQTSVSRRFRAEFKYTAAAAASTTRASTLAKL